MNKLVSIIIPTYNGSDKIEKTINGILQQTYSSYEIIVVDDNGEGTEEQIKTARALEKYKNVNYLTHKVNINGSAARNTGIRSAKGEYLAFVDDDDVWMNNKLEEQVKCLEQLDQSWGLVYCPYILIETEDSARLFCDKYEGNVLYEFLVEKSHIACSSILIRKSVLESVIGFDESFRRHQDWEFIARIAKEYKIAFAGNTLVYKYAVRRNSPKDLKVLIHNRLYYLEKMKNVIETLPAKKQRAVYDYHNVFIAKECLRRKKIAMCMKWVKKTKMPVINTLKIFVDVIKYTIRKKHKKSLDELNGQYMKEHLMQ